MISHRIQENWYRFSPNKCYVLHFKCLYVHMWDGKNSLVYSPQLFWACSIPNQNNGKKDSRELKWNTHHETRASRQIEMFVAECIIKCSKSYDDITLYALCNVSWRWLWIKIRRCEHKKWQNSWKIEQNLYAINRWRTIVMPIKCMLYGIFNMS